MSARIIAISNQKGGTGKTTTAVNLSAALAMFGQKVLLIDLDPQGNSTSGVGIDKNAITCSIYNVLIDEVSVADAGTSDFFREMSNLTEEMSNLKKHLSVLPSNVDLTGAEIELVAVMGREYRLKKALDLAREDYDFIIIDSPPSLGLLTINALTAADSVLVPVQCEYYALEGLTQLLSTINLVKENLNSALEIEGLLLTMADYRTNLTQQVIAEVREHFKDKAYRAVIPRSIRLTEAPSYGKPILFYDKDSIGAKKYAELAAEILHIDAAQPQQINRIKGIVSASRETVVLERETVKVEEVPVDPSRTAGA